MAKHIDDFEKMDVKKLSAWMGRCDKNHSSYMEAKYVYDKKRDSKTNLVGWLTLFFALISAIVAIIALVK